MRRTPPVINGSCLCGRLRYEIEGAFEGMVNCHCSMCRKHHGAAFATFALTAATQFRWLAGESEVARFESSPGMFRTFCPVCGSNAPIVSGDSVYVPAGNLDDDPGIAPEMHIYVNSKAPWHVIADQLPQFAEEPPPPG